MQLINAAPKRPSEKPALASNASENMTMAKAREKIPIPTLKHTRNRRKDTTATRRRARSEEGTVIIHIQDHNTARQTPGKTQATGTAQDTHSTLLKSSNRPMAAARRRQGQQLYAWHGTPSRRPPLTAASEATQPQPPALPPQAWPWECNTDKARQPKRDKVFINTTQLTAEEYGPNLLARGQNMWACVCTSACACVGVFARVCPYAYMCIVRVHACMCLRGVRSACACACIRARVCLHVCVRMHACSYAGACVRAWSGPRVPGCMRVCACALVYVMCMCIRILARMRACVCVCALMREYSCICMCACTEKCIYNIHEHIKAARVVS